MEICLSHDGDGANDTNFNVSSHPLPKYEKGNEAESEADVEGDGAGERCWGGDEE